MAYHILYVFSIKHVSIDMSFSVVHICPHHLLASYLLQVTWEIPKPMLFCSTRNHQLGHLYETCTCPPTSRSTHAVPPSCLSHPPHPQDSSKFSFMMWLKLQGFSSTSGTVMCSICSSITLQLMFFQSH